MMRSDITTIKHLSVRTLKRESSEICQIRTRLLKIHRLRAPIFLKDMRLKNFLKGINESCLAAGDILRKAASFRTARPGSLQWLAIVATAGCMTAIREIDGFLLRSDSHVVFRPSMPGSIRPVMLQKIRLLLTHCKAFNLQFGRKIPQIT